MNTQWRKQHTDTLKGKTFAPLTSWTQRSALVAGSGDGDDPFPRTFSVQRTKPKSHNREKQQLPISKQGIPFNPSLNDDNEWRSDRREKNPSYYDILNQPSMKVPPLPGDDWHTYFNLEICPIYAKSMYSTYLNSIYYIYTLIGELFFSFISCELTCTPFGIKHVPQQIFQFVGVAVPHHQARLDGSMTYEL